MAPKYSRKLARPAALALVAAALSLPGLADAQVRGGRGAESSDQGERLGGERSGRGDRGAWQQRSNASQQQAQQQRPQRNWTFPAPQPQPAAAPAPVQSTRSWDRRDTSQRSPRNWTEADTRRDRTGVNWTEADNRNREANRDRNRDWNRDRDYRRDGRNYHDGYNHAYRRTDNHWDRQWRGNSRYNWQGYRRSHPGTFRLGAYYAPYRGYSYRRLSIGFFLDGLFFSNRYWITDPWHYRLPEVYGPYRWVRYYDDALLVNIYTGEVVDVIYAVFW